MTYKACAVHAYAAPVSWGPVRFLPRDGRAPFSWAMLLFGLSPFTPSDSPAMKLPNRGRPAKRVDLIVLFLAVAVFAVTMVISFAVVIGAVG